MKDYQVVTLIAAIVQHSSVDESGETIGDDNAIDCAMSLMELADLACNKRRDEEHSGDVPWGYSL